MFFLKVTLLAPSFHPNNPGMLGLHVRVSILPKGFSTGHHIIGVVDVIMWTEVEWPLVSPPPQFC